MNSIEEKKPLQNTQLCTFYLGELFLGIEVRAVQEVIRYQETTRVPLASDNIRGLINLRGEIVTAIDLRARLSINSKPVDEPMNVVLRLDKNIVSLLVDDVGDVLDMPDCALERPPKTLQANINDFTRGVYKMDDRLLLLLDAEKVVNLNSRNNHEAESPLH